MFKNIAIGTVVTLLFFWISVFISIEDTLFLFIFVTSLFGLFLLSLLLDINEKVVNILNYIIEVEDYSVPPQCKNTLKEKSNIIHFLHQYTQEVKNADDHKELENIHIKWKSLNEIFWVNPKK